jgi:hypothetical protein
MTDVVTMLQVQQKSSDDRWDKFLKLRAMEQAEAREREAVLRAEEREREAAREERLFRAIGIVAQTLRAPPDTTHQ